MRDSFIRPLLATAFLFGASIANSFAHSPWVTLQGGHYLIKRPNDGDSFHVSVEGHEYIFRLYFVDAPETSAEFRDRVEEQAKYFGVTVDQVLEVGELAKQFTREKLTEPFLVRTCWEDAGGAAECNASMPLSKREPVIWASSWLRMVWLGAIQQRPSRRA